MTEDAIESEVHALLGSPGVSTMESTVVGNTSEPSLRTKRRQLIFDTVESRREVMGEHLRFIVSDGSSQFFQDDARCWEVYRNLGVPFTRIVPDQGSDAQVMAVLGVSASTLETRFREFLTRLNEARQPALPLASPPADNAAEMLKVLLALMKENAEVKGQLSGLIGKLEGKSGAPETATLNETMETAKKSMEAVNAYTGLWSEIYTATKAVLDLLS
jgi:hypothetical protein